MMREGASADGERDGMLVGELEQLVQMLGVDGFVSVEGLWALSNVMSALCWEMRVVDACRLSAWWIGREISHGLKWLMMAGQAACTALENWRLVDLYVQSSPGSGLFMVVVRRRERVLQLLESVVRELQAWLVSGVEVPEEVAAWVGEQEQQLTLLGKEKA